MQHLICILFSYRHNPKRHIFHDLYKYPAKAYHQHRPELRIHLRAHDKLMPFDLLFHNDALNFRMRTVPPDILQNKVIGASCIFRIVYVKHHTAHISLVHNIRRKHFHDDRVTYLAGISHCFMLVFCNKLFCDRYSIL